VHSLPPFVYQEQGRLVGLAFELVQLMAQQHNVDPTYQLMPFGRALRMAQTDSDIGVFIVARTSEREEKLQWVGPLISSGVYLYSQMKHPIEETTLSAIKGKYSIGVARRNNDHVYLSNLNFNNLSVVDHQIQTLKMLNLGRIDLTPMSELVMPALAKQAGIDPVNIKRTPIKLYDSHLYIAFSKDISRTTIQAWQQALDTLKANGQYQKILDKYIKPAI